MDAIQTILMGLVGLIIIGSFTVSIFPLLSLYFNNAEVFVVGAIVLVLVGLISVVFMIGIYQRIIDNLSTETQKIRDFQSGLRRE